jgi:hypothetical protein
MMSSMRCSRRTLAVPGSSAFFDLGGCGLHHAHGVLDHVGVALLAYRTAGHQSLSPSTILGWG